MFCSIDSGQNRVYADEYHMTVSWVQVTSFQLIAGSTRLQVDFFATVTCLMFEVNYKLINGSFAFSLG